MTYNHSINHWRDYIKSHDKLSQREKDSEHKRCANVIKGWDCDEDQAWDEVERCMREGYKRLPHIFSKPQRTQKRDVKVANVKTPTKKLSKSPAEETQFPSEWLTAISIWEDHLAAVKNRKWAKEKMGTYFEKMLNLWDDPDEAESDITIITNMTDEKGNAYLGLFIPDKKKVVDKSKLENFGYNAPVFDEIRGGEESILDNYFKQFDEEGGDE